MARYAHGDGSLTGNPLLKVAGLRVSFELESGQKLQAVDGVDLSLEKGEILGLVGESGCGKSVLCLSLLGLIERPGRITAGQIIWNGQDLAKADRKMLRRIRGREIAIIFQNAQAALNPVFTVGQQLGRIIRSLGDLDQQETREETMRLLRLVHTPDPETTIERYPHQLSGGTCQRVLLAMALSCKPRLLVADEPTAALDVTIQAQILDLLLEIRQKFGMAMLLVSHDLGVIARMCDRVAVMYLGRIVELSGYRSLYMSPKHPYTRALLRSIPVPDPSRRSSFHAIVGDVPSGLRIPSGCRFHPRCPDVIAGLCEKVDPSLIHIQTDESQVACLLYAPYCLSMSTKSAENQP